MANANSSKSKARGNEALQIALFKLYRAINKLSTSSQLLKCVDNGVLPEREVDIHVVRDLCQEIMCEEADGLFQTFDDLTEAAGIQFDYPAAQALDHAKQAVQSKGVRND